MIKINSFLIFVITVFLLVSSGCNEKSDDTSKNKSDTKEISSGEFGWKDNVSATDIPDFHVKGSLGGKEVSFAYINFEKWRGSNDNVINFSLVKPAQDCGFIENFEGFTLLNKGAEIKQGTFLKSKFDDDPGSYQAGFKSSGNKSSEKWNCALVIDNITDKKAVGRILIYFNDSNKSWIAGKFEALICNN